MKKIIAITVLLMTLLAGHKGWKVVKKLRHAGRLQIGVAKFKIRNLSTTIKSEVILSIGNFSPSTFVIDQIGINIYTTTGELLATQTNPLPSPITLLPNQNSKLPLTYGINTAVLLSQVHKIGGISSILANQITEGKNGLPIVLKGFIASGNLTKDIDQPLTV
ncbi:hypothetical protein NBT05_12415 [Aquimarina sp. ERC-38]|uniref:hypothetical protein n=1 Tax=Aquimarina sp. ERC-38 TaxID=2949996 RepID=UPI00224867A6|nr:hypothetical protein [Aquimarina sp. ERC-38]UZO79752.1 hypothetical protein NBT05_12415 [Aquimarina sp. ERC-38]